jgi:hypothetical protein
MVKELCTFGQWQSTGSPTTYRKLSLILGRDHIPIKLRTIKSIRVRLELSFNSGMWARGTGSQTSMIDSPDHSR